MYAAFYRGDRLASSSETDFAEIDGRWFPSTIRFYRGDDKTLRKVIDVQRASFDEPWHQQEIIPEDIGVLFGTRLYSWTKDMQCWDGVCLLTADEYDELIYIYGVRPDPRIVEMLAKSSRMTVDQYYALIDQTAEWVRDEYYEKHGEAPWLTMKSAEKDEWDVYVEKFIKKHKLDKPRVKRAGEILKRAKGLRDSHIRKNRREIRKAERRGDQEKLASYEAYTKRVFDKVLVRTLERLIPRKEKVTVSE